MKEAVYPCLHQSVIRNSILLESLPHTAKAKQVQDFLELSQVQTFCQGRIFLESLRQIRQENS